MDNTDVVTDFVKNFLVDPVTFPPLSKIGIFLIICLVFVNYFPNIQAGGCWRGDVTDVREQEEAGDS